MKPEEGIEIMEKLSSRGEASGKVDTKELNAN